MGSVDVCVLSYNRIRFTQTCLEELARRTKHPHRIILVDNGSTDGTAEWLMETFGRSDLVDTLHRNPSNWGVHGGWNLALEYVRSDLLVCVDNDIIPQPGWLTLLVDLMDRYPDYGAICLRAQAFIGQGGNLFEGAGEIKQRSHIPAYCRIMRTDVTRAMGGWRDTKEPGRNNEDWTVGKRMKAQGYKVGFSSQIRCIHLWQDAESPWGYPVGPDGYETVGHREIWPPVWHYRHDRLKIDFDTCHPESEAERVAEQLRAIGLM